MDSIIRERVSSAINTGDVDRVRFELKKWVDHCQSENEWSPYQILVAGAKFFFKEGAYEEALAYSSEANRLLAQIPEIGGGETLKVVLRQAGLSRAPDDVSVKELEIIERKSEARIIEALPDGSDVDAHLAAIRKSLRHDVRGCFIATAAFGTSQAPEIATLRRFRDEVLLRSFPGQWFVSAYQAVSPGLAAIVSRSDLLRRTVRAVLIRPMLVVLKRLGWARSDGDGRS